MIKSTDQQSVHQACFPQINRLQLTDFRSYEKLDLPIEHKMVVLTGDNGAGKTNVIEAISLLSPGKGLRRAELDDIQRAGGPGGYSVSTSLNGAHGPVRLGVGVDRPVSSESQTRRYRVDGESVGSARHFADHLRIVWLTPAMDRLFAGPAGERRRFLDRLVLAVDADHGRRVNAFEKSLRNRNKLLESGTGDVIWLDAAEREIAELGVAVAVARGETVLRLAALINDTRDDSSPFPWAAVTIDGEIDRLTSNLPAVEAEEEFRLLLRANRHRDAAAGRALVGPQTSDLTVLHGPKFMSAGLSSTGEQKALLAGLVLAHARLVSIMCGIMPVILLDEIAAHFDPSRRAALFHDLQELGAHVWMTGADPELFKEIQPRADSFFIAGGTAKRI